MRGGRHESAARTDWAGAIGAAQVLADPASLAACATATFATRQRVVAVLRPASVAEVAACLRIAARHGVPLYPSSAGRNWGFGSRVPAADGCALLDLGRMAAVRGVDAAQGTLTVEPGVSFRAAHAALLRAAPGWYLPIIGGPPEASVLGNLVERGEGFGPTGDRAASLLALEVVLPEGEVLGTGFAGLPGAAMAGLDRHGPGPALDGLFLQSALGVVTAATLALSPRPRHPLLLTAQAAELPALVDALHALVRDEVIRPGCLSLWNAAKLRMRSGARLRPGPQPWRATALIGAPLRPVAQALGRHARAALAASGARARLWDAAAAAPLLGEPEEENPRSVYWPKPGPVPPVLRPEADGCGLHWACVAAPFAGAALAAAMAAAERILAAAGLPPNLGAHAVTGRSLHIFAALQFDRAAPGREAAAAAALEAVLDAWAAMGLYPNRLGIQSMGRMAAVSATHAAVLRRLKTALDPAGILAPGRYAVP